MKKLIILINIFIFYLYFNLNISSFSIPNNLMLGDFILREGIGIESELIKLATNSKYTHIGIISSINPTKILHATYEDFGFSGVVQFDLKDFLNGAKEVKIIRLKNLKDKEKLINDLKAKLKSDFVLDESENALYCTTYIYNDLKKYLNIELNKTYLDLPINKGYYLLPSEFLKLEHEVIFEERDYLKWA